MIDLFRFITSLIRENPEVIAAFIMGLVVAGAFLTYAIYWIIGTIYKKKVSQLEIEARSAGEKLKDAQQERDEQKKKAKDRKAKLDDAVQAAKADLDAAQKNYAAKEAAAKQQFSDLAAKYNKLGSVAMSLKKQVTSLNDQAKRFEKLQGQLWDLPVDPGCLLPFRTLGNGQAAIIAVINLKGGVGKTTLTANLAATYSRIMGKRVLAVDLDFQASLTNLCLPAERIAELQIGDGRLVDNVFKDWSAGLAHRAFNNLSPTLEPKLHLLANSEKLARVEEEAKARWIMQHHDVDLRCVLRLALHDPVFQDNFDVILIDCPPRWTTGSINAMACCDYVLIPTQLDRVSAEAVPRLLGWLRDLRRASPELYGHFEILGVLGNLAYPRSKLIAQEQGIWEELPAKCKATWKTAVHHFDTIIKDKAEFRRAANSREFAALHPDLQPEFRQLVNEIETRRSAYESR